MNDFDEYGYCFWHTPEGWRWGYDWTEVDCASVGPFPTYAEAVASYFAEDLSFQAEDA